MIHNLSPDSSNDIASASADNFVLTSFLSIDGSSKDVTLTTRSNLEGYRSEITSGGAILIIGSGKQWLSNHLLESQIHGRIDLAFLDRYI